MTKCAWTGQEFKPVSRGGNEKKFASPAAKSEAHKAARMFAEHMIETGLLSWDAIKRWYDTQKPAPAPSYTTPQADAPGPDAIRGAIEGFKGIHGPSYERAETSGDG